MRTGEQLVMAPGAFDYKPRENRNFGVTIILILIGITYIFVTCHRTSGSSNNDRSTRYFRI